MRLPDADFPADPYPGAVPPWSFVHVDGVAHELAPDPWRVGRIDLDAWLAEHGAAPAARRLPVLAYGSNRCPSKITWLRRELGLGADPVVALRARTRGVAAVWAAGLRYRDGQRPAVLAAWSASGTRIGTAWSASGTRIGTASSASGTGIGAAVQAVEEGHFVWLATPEQIAVLDRCEGRDDRFRLARLRTGGGTEVRTEDGALLEDPWCYLGHAAIRRPLLVDGAPLRCADVPQAVARDLTGVAAPGDGLTADTVVGTPRPDEWPAALFAYGLLQPGEESWRLVGPHAAGGPRPATVPGTVFDTGRGWPAWLPEVAGRTVGVIVPLRDPAALLPELDRYEGPDYERVRTVVPADGAVCWAYAWRGPTDGFTPLPHGWPRRAE